MRLTFSAYNCSVYTCHGELDSFPVLKTLPDDIHGGINEYYMYLILCDKMYCMSTFGGSEKLSDQYFPMTMMLQNHQLKKDPFTEHRF